jgi:hypothetical protein
MPLRVTFKVLMVPALSVCVRVFVESVAPFISKAVKAKECMPPVGTSMVIAQLVAGGLPLVVQLGEVLLRGVFTGVPPSTAMLMDAVLGETYAGRRVCAAACADFGGI